jgi:hypothetical protein
VFYYYVVHILQSVVFLPLIRPVLSI